MIKAIELRLQHWADQYRMCQLGGNGWGVTPLAVAMECGGLIGGSSGSGRAGLLRTMDSEAEQVDIALDAIRRRGVAADAKLEAVWLLMGSQGVVKVSLETSLFMLARVRYLPTDDGEKTVKRQMRILRIGSEDTYGRRVHRLHEYVEGRLEAQLRCAA